jgi:methyl-CpG-binding domain protein 4
MKNYRAGIPLRDDLMVQEQIDGSWQHMVGVICLNQTNRKQVKAVLPNLLGICPTPVHLINTAPDTIKMIIKPLGMVNVREKRLRQMSKDYLTWDGNDATMLYGIGKYGSDSYEIFFKDNYNVQPTDGELQRYLKEEVFDVVETA